MTKFSLPGAAAIVMACGLGLAAQTPAAQKPAAAAPATKPAMAVAHKSAAPAHTKRALFEHVIARLHQKKVIEDGAF